MTCPHGLPTCPHCAAHGFDQASCTHGFFACPHCKVTPPPLNAMKCLMHARRTKGCALCALTTCQHFWTGPGCIMCRD